jgi:hypothetical protein
MKPLPGHEATTKELDQYFNEYWTVTQQSALAAEKLTLYLAGKLEKAEERAANIKKIPNQARGWIKWRKGISDDLKGKCLPRNKHTADVIKMLKKAAEEKRKAMNLALKAGHLYRLTEVEVKKPFFLKAFAQAYLQGSLDDYAKFEKMARQQYKVAVFDEKTAIDLLEGYIKEKGDMKKAPPEEYKQFKATYELIVKNMKD